MVITILEGRLTPVQAGKLRDLYRAEAPAAPPGFTSYLLNDQADRAVWRIVTLWDSQSALDDMRRSGQTPRGRAMFLEAGVEPQLSIHDVPERIGG